MYEFGMKCSMKGRATSVEEMILQLVAFQGVAKGDSIITIYTTIRARIRATKIYPSSRLARHSKA